MSRAQLRDCGLSDDTIDRAVRAGHLHRVFRSVYAVGRSAIGERGRMRAAVLACPDESVVSHRSAAALLRLVDRAPKVVDVISPGTLGRKIDGIRAHLVSRPEKSETGTVDGIPCTSPARTLIDLAGCVTGRTLRSAFERAASKRMLDLDAIEAVGYDRRLGAGTLRALIHEWRDAAPIAKRSRLKSPLEAMVLPLLARDGLPRPRANVPVELAGGSRIEVDFLWAEHRFVLEADSRDFHGAHAAFERDRWRDRELMRVGFSTLRVTRLQAEQEPEAIADTIAVRLTAAISDSAPSPI